MLGSETANRDRKNPALKKESFMIFRQKKMKNKEEDEYVFTMCVVYSPNICNDDI
jgi:hypothetical protein